MNPITFNEKIQWIKLYDRNPMYTQLSDKYHVREFVANTIGEQYLVPLLGVWNDFDNICFNDLPDEFVLKCNHDCGSVVICTSKSDFNVKKARKKLKKSLKRNFYRNYREWQYKNIEPMIIAEKYLGDASSVPTDYKVHCFDGIPKLIQVDFDRFISHKRNIYNVDWEYLDIFINKPVNKDYIVEVTDAKKKIVALSQSIATKTGAAYLRVDWFCVNDKLYIGELTFTHENGTATILPLDFAETMGSWIELPTPFNNS